MVLKTDAERRVELSACGKRIGRGVTHANNDCFSDSLLQLLAYNGIVDPGLQSNTSRRKQLCKACRDHLLMHDDESVRPGVRLVTGQWADVSDSEHAAAFLEHDRHFQEALSFFIAELGEQMEIWPCGVRLVVFSRLDFEEGLPQELAVVVGRADFLNDSDLGPPVELEMYNSTGAGVTGFHYDPVFRKSPGVDVKQVSKRRRRHASCIAGSASDSVGAPAAGGNACDMDPKADADV